LGWRRAPVSHPTLAAVPRHRGGAGRGLPRAGLVADRPGPWWQRAQLRVRGGVAGLRALRAVRVGPGGTRRTAGWVRRAAPPPLPRGPRGAGARGAPPPPPPPRLDAPEVSAYTDSLAWLAAHPEARPRDYHPGS